MSLINKITKRICKVEWQVAIRERKSKSLDFSQDKNYFVPIPNSFRYWAADPFIIDYKGKTLLFVELYDRLKRKGLLGYMDITNGIKSSYKIVYETNCHLSYPMAFIMNDNLYVIPESNNIGKLLQLKWNDNANVLELDRTFMEGYNLADTNFLKYKDEVYMLTTPVDKQDNVSKLCIYKRQDAYKYNPCGKNPVVHDKSTARNGGMLIENEGNYYRVSQDCSNGYGSGLNILRIDEISITGYKETLIKKIFPNDIIISGKNIIDGIHTYNSNQKYEVIDFKINNKFSLAEILGFFLCKLHIYNKIEK